MYIFPKLISSRFENTLNLSFIYLFIFVDEAIWLRERMWLFKVAQGVNSGTEACSNSYISAHTFRTQEINILIIRLLAYYK